MRNKQPLKYNQPKTSKNIRKIHIAIAIDKKQYKHQRKSQ